MRAFWKEKWFLMPLLIELLSSGLVGRERWSQKSTHTIRNDQNWESSERGKLLKKKVDDRSEMRVDRSYSTEGMEWKLASLIILTNFSIALLCRFNFCYRTRCCFDGKIDQEILTTCHIELASTRFRKKVRKKILRFGQFFLLFFYCDLNYFS